MTSSSAVPVLPVVLPLAVLAFVAVVGRLHHRGRLTVPRVLAAAVASGYGAAVLDAVLLPMPLVLGSARNDLEPWRIFVNLMPLTGLDDPIGIVLNVALFVPMGLLLPLLLRTPSAARVVTTGLLVSLAIELTQLLTDITISTGRVADVDDLLANTAGTVLGYAVFTMASTFPRPRRTVGDGQRGPVEAPTLSRS